MKLSLLSDVTSQALTAALKGAAIRHRAIADNIANIDTPGFVRNQVEFEQALAAALVEARRAPSGSPGAISRLPLRAQKDWSAPARADGNNVDIDREMAALTRNALGYRAAAEMLGARIRMLRAVIGRGR